ncbi:MAG: murein biosynthesis integral membrane protein MurJ [Clostridia bacterium]|nr:murein biosynthesis integral membrane protein MurJ [Clostridia bacterium]
MKKNIVKTFSLVFVITAISKCLGLLRDIVFAKYYGTGYVSDAFFAATRIPTQLVDIILSSAIVSTFVPIFNQILQKDGREKANHFANNFVNIVALISSAIAILGILFAPQVVHLLAGGFDAETFNLTVELIRITFPMIIFTAIAYSLVGLLQSYGEFNIPAAISAVSNLVIIIFLVLFREKFGIHGLAACMLFAWFLQVAIQIPFAKKFGYPFHLKVNLKDENIKNVFLLAIPVFISTAVLPINNLVSTRIASGMGDNALSAMEYAYKLYVVISGIFTYAIGNIIFPEMSRASADNDKKEYQEIILKALRMMCYVLIPLSIGIMIYRQDIVSVIYERGEFDALSTLRTSSILMYFAFGIIGAGIVEIMNKAFYAKQDTKSPLIAGVIMVVLNVVLCLIFSKIIGVEGLALATSLTALANAITLIVMANRKEKMIDRTFLLTIAKMIGASLVMGLVVVLLNNWLVGVLSFKIVRMGIGAVIGVVTYYALTYLLNVDEIKILGRRN